MSESSKSHKDHKGGRRVALPVTLNTSAGESSSTLAPSKPQPHGQGERHLPRSISGGSLAVNIEVQLAARQERSSSAGVRRKGNVHAPVAQGSHPHAIVMQQKVEMKFELGGIKDELNNLHSDLELLKKAFHMVHRDDPKLCNKLAISETPEIRMFQKMLASPYAVIDNQAKVTTSHASEPVDEEKELLKTIMTLAPSRPMLFRFYFPSFNLNSVSEDHLKLLGSADFDILSFKESILDEVEREHYMCLLVMHMYHRLGLVYEFRIPEQKLYRFVGILCRRYRHVPFHNWYHAFNVTQTMFFLLTTCECRKLLKPLELLTLITAALCHDADHPGLNNVFHIKAHTRVGILHKTSTLENHHYLQALSVLHLPECQIFEFLEKAQLATAYEYIRHIILATDLSLHKIILQSMEAHGKRLSKQFHKKKPGKLNKDETIAVMCCIMKCSDLSNEIRPSQIADKWAALINQEFSDQSATEKKLGLPLTPWIDPDKIIMEKEQINFIKGLCLPLYQTLQSVFSPVEVCIQQLNSNLQNWEDRLIEEAKGIREVTDRSVFQEDQQKGTGKSLADQLASLASGAVSGFSGFGIGIGKNSKKDKKK